MAFDGYLVVEWPKLWLPALAEPDEVLPTAIGYVRSRLAVEQAVLTAYKGDKKPASFAGKRPIEPV
jgi:hypothetical protein